MLRPFHVLPPQRVAVHLHVSLPSRQISRPSFISRPPMATSSHRSSTACVHLRQVQLAPIALTYTKSFLQKKVDSLKCHAAAEASKEPKSQSTSTVVPLGKMAIYILLWYGFNIIFNIYNKQALNAFQCPWFISSLQLAACCLIMGFMWITGLQAKPKFSKDLFKALAPVALFHTIGHVSACVSFSMMAVSFAHIVKAAEPIFSVALSGPILKEVYPLGVWLSLIPIAFGCSLSAMKEISFSWGGFNSAMISNLGMVFRGIYSKKTLNEYKDMDGINLFGLISIVSLMYCLPLSIIVEGSKWGPGYAAAVEAIGSSTILTYLAISSLFYHLYNQASYMVLGLGIAPVTFSVGNTMKRVAVVISSILFFKNPVSILNGIGSAVAILGTLLYSLAKGKAAEDKKKSTS